jgi:hypothetical protein
MITPYLLHKLTTPALINTQMADTTPTPYVLGAHGWMGIREDTCGTVLKIYRGNYPPGVDEGCRHWHTVHRHKPYTHAQ